MIILIGCFGGSAEDRYRENQLDDYLNSLDVPEEIENPCGYCESEAEILEVAPTNPTNESGGSKEDLVCRECRKHHIKIYGGIKAYYAKFKIESVELI